MEKVDYILEKAGECLNCKKPRCREGCPIATHIPDFIQEIKKENFGKAYEILQENNAMSEICSMVCPTENQCMGSCVRGIKGNPVDINKLENFVNKWAEENNVKYNIVCQKGKKSKIAIVGSGPAGLACAVELRKKGYKVTIFEKEEIAGGLLEYGIPDFRLPKSIVRNIVKRIENIGVEIKTNVELGKDITINSLKNDGYEAIFLAIGAEIANTYKLSEEEHQVYKSDEVLKRYYNKKYIENLGKVIVIGGGNVAIDSARVAKRMGAEKVQIVYRRTRELMPAIDREVEEALDDGVEFVYNTRVMGIEGKNAKCIKTKIEDGKVIDVPNSEFEIPQDTVIFAIGLGINKNLLESIGIEAENGLVKIDENHMTNVPMVFAGGDLTEKKSTVCRAIHTGKVVAEKISEILL